MLTILAILIILLGLYLIVSGLREDMYYEEWVEEEEKERQEETEERKVDVKGGGVILIGPIPIVFGNSKYAMISLILAIILMILSIFLMLSLP